MQSSMGPVIASLRTRPLSTVLSSRLSCSGSEASLTLIFLRTISARTTCDDKGHDEGCNGSDDYVEKRLIRLPGLPARHLSFLSAVSVAHDHLGSTDWSILSVSDSSSGARLGCGGGLADHRGKRCVKTTNMGRHSSGGIFNFDNALIA